MQGRPAPVGRKKLVPALSRETKCTHSYEDDGELCLEIDCVDCPGAQELANNRCLAGIVHIIATEARPETLVLKRQIHKRYRESFLGPVFELASEIAALNRALSARPELSDRECQTCDASMPRMLGRLRREILERPTEFIEDRASAVDSVIVGVAEIACESRRACVARALTWLQKGLV